jgi:glycosyltransferase involved in cell wall biosynthesis
LLNQTHKDFQLVISNNCSTDQTSKIIEEYRDKFENVIVENQNQNMGLPWNFNRVVNLSNGKYFMWVPHDDFHEPSFITETLNLLESDDSVVLAMSLSEAVLTSRKETLWVASLDSFRHCVTPLQRYKEAAQNFPAVAMYGIYNRAAMLRAGLLPGIIGGDLIFIRALSLQGQFRSGNKVLFTRKARDSWNTRETDRLVFLGKEANSGGLIVPAGLLVLKKDLNNIVSANLDLATKIRLFTHIIYVSIGKYLKRKIAQTLILLQPINKRKAVALKLYNSWFTNPNIVEYSSENFYRRIIVPSLRLTNKI